jgi:integrase
VPGRPALLPTLLSGHSLRAGYATAAARAGIEERKIANVTRHKNLPTLRGYIRHANLFDDVDRVL